MAVPLQIRVLDHIRRRAGGDVPSMDLEEIRRARRTRVPAVPLIGGLLATATTSVIGDVGRDVMVEEVTVPGGEGDLPARLYRPSVVAPARPMMLYLHGGGWVIGGPSQYDWICGELARQLGTVVISIDYRKAPEHRAPAAADDAIAAARWIMTGGGKSLGAPGPLVVGGDSAGGNLAALVAIAARDEGLDGLAAQLLIYPATDLTMTSRSAMTLTHEPILHRSDMDAFVGHYLGDEIDPSDPRVSPLHVDDLHGLAPACVITAEQDPLRDEGRAYADRLTEAGVEVRFTEYVDMPHGFVSLPGLTVSARQAVAEMVAFAAPRLGVGV